ncbi:hypothetical protein JMJ77_0005500 [Colletotrichum scovillei]|uniref:Uncharacterized protein n=1 Tax=Colletotrichum scovillei TaxID=1209932 RepID=A0A9P7UIT1_9PEZI|nr:hypothetical protein JMJ77_0005500 [Colletotrichum scovillei]KAG7076723.1 hypothetical protein JMJ76_0013983 [Colletotrichum scovillei]KAG7083772.1 hypothetical protein JMJ78_0009214 [Colletotrichum scovillei]
MQRREPHASAKNGLAAHPSFNDFRPALSPLRTGRCNVIAPAYSLFTVVAFHQSHCAASPQTPRYMIIVS